MFNNYFKIALRNIFRQKGYSFINIAGMALGMVGCIFLLLQVYDEQSFDKFHENVKNLYRLEQDQKSSQGNYHVLVSQFPAGPTLKENLREIKNTCRWVSLGRRLMRHKDKIFYEDNVTSVDSSFLQMFSFPLINGNPETALNQPSSIVLSQTMAKKYFGNQNPIGKAIAMNNKYEFFVSGVMKDAPDNSTLKPGMLVPFSWFIEGIPENWKQNFLTTWVELYENVQINSINKKITDLIVARTHRDAASRSTAPDYMLMPLANINLYGYSEYDQGSATINKMKIYVILAFIILLMACINYMNLATARAASRAKEIGLRKTVGAQRKQIMSQFFSESILLAFMSFIFALIIVILLLPLYNDLTGKQFTVGSLFNSEFLIVLLFVALVTGLISGSFPALFLSSFSPIKALKGNPHSGVKSNFFRKTLVVFQFCLSVILIIGTIVAFQQLQFMRSKKAGYEKDHLLYLPLRGEAVNSYKALKQELLKTPNVLNVSGIDQTPTDIGTNSSGAKWDGKDPNSDPLITTAAIDYDFIETMKIKMVEGRPFSKSFSTDASNGFLVNEELLKIMGTKSGVGKNFSFLGVDGQIVGVMKNYHYYSVREKIAPLALQYSKQPYFAVIRLKGRSIPAAIKNVKSVWQKMAPLYPFEYKFFDEDYAAMYKADEQMGNIFKYGAIFTIMIACLGLFGFASFMTEKRTKEIGIRKTLGASVSGITVLLAKEFVKWVLIANIVAWPIAYVLLNNWLKNYAYRISMEWRVFAVSTILTVLIAVITVSYQAIKAALANPIIGLKYE